MQKIPTVFVRDEQDRRYVTDDITPGCEWVFTDRGVRGERKYGGEREVAYTDRRSGKECTTKAFRSWWEVEPAPRFVAEPGSWLAEQIPPMPSLAGTVAD